MDQWFWEWFHGEVRSTTDSLSDSGEISKPLGCSVSSYVKWRWLYLSYEMAVKIRNNMCKVSSTELSVENQNKKSGIGRGKERHVKYEYCVNMAQLSPRYKVKVKQENASNSFIRSTIFTRHSVLASHCAQHRISRRYGDLIPVRKG